MTRTYVGRVNGPARMKNFRGMNPASSEINQDPNGALTMVNCDISTIGSVKMRKGWIPVDVSPALPGATVDGVIDLKTSSGEALIVFCSGKVFRIVGNVSTNITAALTITPGFRWRGDQSHDHVFMANGVDQPLVIGLTGNAVTYSAYSIANSVTPPIPVGVTIDTPPANTWHSTAHGLLNGNQVKLVTSGTLPAPFVVGTTYYIVGRTTDTFQLSATLGGSPITYTTAGSGTFAYSQTGVDQTPSSWIAKPPHGFILLNQLGAERMWAWNLETVFYSAISEPWDYVAANNAGFIDIRPGDGDSVVAVTGSYGYVAVMMQARTLIYNGTGPNDLALSHVLPMGCTSPDSIMTIGDDIVFLSPYGPSNLKRFINGTQLIQNIIGFQIAPLMHQVSSLDGWGKCVAYHDIVNRRVIWWLPEGDLPTQGFVYQYDVQSWPGTWSGWTINCVTRTSGNQLIAGTTGGKLMILNQGGDDNGAEISAYYSTAWFDKGEPERNMTCPFMEIWLRASGVRMSVTANWDQGEIIDTQDISYITSGGEWGEKATDVNPSVKWWGPTGIVTTTVTTKPTTHDVSTSASNASVSNPASAYDFAAVNDLTTWSEVFATSDDPLISRFAELVVRGFSALPAQSYLSKTLNVNLATTDFQQIKADGSCSVSYSLDGGATWTGLQDFTFVTAVLQTFSVPLPVGQDETLVRVKARVQVMEAHLPVAGPFLSQINLSVSDVWIDGIHKESGLPITEDQIGTWGTTSYARTRQDIYGIGRAVQFTFQMNGSGDAEILAYRPDLRSKGLL